MKIILISYSLLYNPTFDFRLSNFTSGGDGEYINRGNSLAVCDPFGTENHGLVFLSSYVYTKPNM